MKQDIGRFLLVLAGALIATVLLGSLARAGEYWAIPVILVLGVLVLLGIKKYRERKVQQELQERARRRRAMAMRTTKKTKGDRNG